MINYRIKKIIEENPVALATTDNENNPHVIAVTFAKVKKDNLVITNNYMKKTLENINKNPNVSLVVWNSDLKGVQIKGIANYFKKGDGMILLNKSLKIKMNPAREF